MSDDLVERLRKWAISTPGDTSMDLIHVNPGLPGQAADEIERLRTTLERVTKERDEARLRLEQHIDAYDRDYGEK